MGRRRDPEIRKLWEARFRAWRRSGLTQSEFCQREGIARSGFGRWRRELGYGDAAEEPVRLVAVEVGPEAEPGTLRATEPAALTLVLGSYRVEVGDGFSPSCLARLIHTLERL